jgi:hypothetical protein
MTFHDWITRRRIGRPGGVGHVWPITIASGKEPSVIVVQTNRMCAACERVGNNTVGFDNAPDIRSFAYFSLLLSGLRGEGHNTEFLSGVSYLRVYEFNLTKTCLLGNLLETVLLAYHQSLLFSLFFS